MFEKKNSYNRFEVKRVGEKNPIETYILTDKKTGVQYLYAWGGAGGGLTPLLDKNGEVIVKNIIKY
ncbi:DUF6440 family protein [uncultured Clostridium sp.]|uniref:DUF6440 family protein n=1 Tax=uncultured Clostridium sp. TaxID=59620 RepID=UPI0025E94242|nr:DUF6440 family protein [uncultured Clostridium sp.]MDU4882931.1 DUF6440 family protein [Clostridium celatum]MDU7076168.1 DUF6440 family protein [Clostridium celatum]